MPTNTSFAALEVSMRDAEWRISIEMDILFDIFHIHSNTYLIVHVRLIHKFVKAKLHSARQT